MLDQRRVEHRRTFFFTAPPAGKQDISADSASTRQIDWCTLYALDFQVIFVVSVQRRERWPNCQVTSSKLFTRSESTPVRRDSARYRRNFKTEYLLVSARFILTAILSSADNRVGYRHNDITAFGVNPLFHPASSLIT
jgi:hypothetical protein